MFASNCRVASCNWHVESNAWWRHQMESFFALLAICAGNSPVPGEFPTQRPVTRIFDVFFDLRLNKRLSKQSWGWWLETLSRPLLRHRDAIVTSSTEREQSEWDTESMCEKRHYFVKYGLVISCDKGNPRTRNTHGHMYGIPAYWITNIFCCVPNCTQRITFASLGCGNRMPIARPSMASHNVVCWHIIMSFYYPIM